MGLAQREIVSRADNCIGLRLGPYLSESTVITIGQVVELASCPKYQQPLG